MEPFDVVRFACLIGVAFFVWSMCRVAADFIASRPARAQYLAEMQARPLSCLAVIIMLICLIIFLYGLGTAGTAIGIEHIQIAGWPVSVLALPVGVLMFYLVEI